MCRRMVEVVFCDIRESKSAVYGFPRTVICKKHIIIKKTSFQQAAIIVELNIISYIKWQINQE